MATVKKEVKHSDANKSGKGNKIKFPIALKLLRASPKVRVAGPKPIRAGTKTPGAYRAGADGVYVFRFAELDPTRAGGTKKARNYYADTRAVVVEGKKIMVGLAHEKAGMGSRPHHHPNDQFNFVLKGTLRVKIGDEPEMLVPAGSVVYFPAGVVHSSGATADEDVVFYVCKDLAWGLTGIPLDKRASGPRKGFAAVKR